ncbi:spindle assembly checkpoint component Mad1 [Mycena filopes]|nr:spindle assembly checkpoint component Mad1 [Mycena filopes]
MAHSSLERQLLAAQTTKLELETKLREKDMQIEKLERDRRWFSDREQEEREEKERERREYEEQTEKKDSELRTLRTSLTALREEFADLQDAHSSLSRNTSQTIASQKSQITTLTRQASLLEEEVSQFKLLAEERSQTIDEIQVQFQELSTSGDNHVAEQENNDMAVVRDELHRQAAYLRTLESTNAKLSSELAILRERHTSIEVLREEKRGLERKLLPLEGLREQVVKLEAQVEAGRQERETWARNQASSDGSTFTPSKTPVGITQSLSALRLQHAQLLEDHGVTLSILRSKEAELANTALRATEDSETIEKLQNEVNVLKDKAYHYEQRTSLAEREVGFTKALLASFSLEESNKEGTSLAIDGARAEQLQQLERLLEDYKATNSRLTAQLNEVVDREPVSVAEQRRQELEAERTGRIEAQQALDGALAEVKTQLEKIEQLEQELFELGGEIAGGRHVPPGIRVLTFRDTPDMVLRDSPEARQIELGRLKQENAALVHQLEGLQHNGARAENASTEGVIPKETWDAMCVEHARLKEEVNNTLKRRNRLQEVFASKAEEFKASVAALLGVKLGFFPGGDVRVTSLYDPDATFVFKPSSTGMQLYAQGEGGPEDLPNLMAYWVGTEQCIPGFLASVTLELYEKQKAGVTMVE